MVGVVLECGAEVSPALIAYGTLSLATWNVDISLRFLPRGDEGRTISVKCSCNSWEESSRSSYTACTRKKSRVASEKLRSSIRVHIYVATHSVSSLWTNETTK